MNDELERLREVARAVAALIEADDESNACVRPSRDRTGPPPAEELGELHRLIGVYYARRTNSSPPSAGSPRTAVHEMKHGRSARRDGRTS